MKRTEMHIETNVLEHAQPHSHPHSDSHSRTEGAHYSAKDLAKELGIGDSTLRTRWFEWIVQVAPEELLKDKQGYSPLARQLFIEFSQVAKNQRKAWVTEAKARYAHEWGSVGVIDGELMPPDVGGALAKITQKNSAITKDNQSKKLALLDLIEQVKTAEANFSEAEIKQHKAAGVKRGLEQFKLETQAQISTVSELRKMLLEEDS